MGKLDELEARIRALELRDPRQSVRYPYTYACDYIRKTFDIETRAEASAAMQKMSEILGQTDHRKVAIAFAEAYIADCS